MADHGMMMSATVALDTCNMQSVTVSMSRYIAITGNTDIFDTVLD